MYVVILLSETYENIAFEICQTYCPKLDLESPPNQNIKHLYILI
jgi:hypothetical protein